MDLLFTVVAFVVALGVLITFHEFGHFLVARLCGVKVLRFSVGFGRPLLTWRAGKDATEWVLATFPLGGYVKMLDEREREVSPQERPRAFNTQSVYRRFAIVVAGPLANFLLAFGLYWLMFMAGIPGIKPVLGPVLPGTPAAFAGFREGETLLRIQDAPVATWQDARWALLGEALKKTAVAVEVRDARDAVAVRTLDLSGIQGDDLGGEFLDKLGLTPFRPVLKPVIGRVVDGGAGARAGLRPGDLIVSINGGPVFRWDGVVEAVRGSPGRTLKLELDRQGARIRVDLAPEAVMERGREVGKIGIAPHSDPGQWRDLMVNVSYGPLDSGARSLQKTWDTSVLTLKMLYHMIAGDVSWRNVSGPITIADYAGQSAQMGWIAYLNFLALVSISLGILNLLPIPVLDGGHLMYYIAELIKGRPVSERAMEVGQQVGIALLFVLMAFALYNDINRLVSG